jgi:hypothetical protein
MKKEKKGMSDIMLADVPIEQRAQILRDSCDQIEERHYTRKFEQPEINERREELAGVSIQINNLSQELKEVNAEYKSRIKPQEERRVRILEELKSGGEYVKSECYKFVDAELGKVGWYTPEGYKLEERDINPEERQRTVFQVKRQTGTDD